MLIGSLFSGIGGLELGLEAAGLGHTAWQVEKDAWCRATLARHWPSAERIEDVCTAGRHNLRPVNLICGGFPCQDVSSAGARAGLAGSRSGLWRHFARIVSELLPEWVVVENVASGAKLWVDTVRSNLAESGYATIPIPVRADWLGAPYERARVFVVGRRGMADANRDCQRSLSGYDEVAGASPPAGVAGGSREAANVDRVQLREQPGWRSRGPHGEGASFDFIDRWREPMPSVAGVVSRAPRGMAQHAAGNCVVPAQALVAGYVIREILGA